MHIKELPEDQELITQLIYHNKKRTETRRKLLRLLRENKHLFVNDNWIERKMRLGYLGDLSDSNLVFYARTVYQSKAIKETLEMLL